MKRQIIITVAVLILLTVLTTGFVLYGRGYQFGFQQGQPKIVKTGILDIQSNPTDVQIFIDDHPTATTKTSINLSPGKHKVKVAKDGYYDWQKDIEIEKEVVSHVNARLLPRAPSLQSVSTFSVNSAIVDPSGTKLAFQIASQSAVRRNGVYVFDMTSRAFPVLVGQSSTTQIASDIFGASFSEANLTWSPDGKQLLASISGMLDTPTYYLLKADSLNEEPQDVTLTLDTITEAWEALRTEKERALLKTLRPSVKQFADKHFRILAWSPDAKKILYQASESATMPVFLKPRRIGNNPLYERRDLEKNSIYVYNMTEDINTRLVEEDKALCTGISTECVTPFTWFPDSYHLLYVHDKKIDIIEADGANLTTIYGGPFIDKYVYPWPDGSKIVILTNLNNPDVEPTLYTIGLK